MNTSVHIPEPLARRLNDYLEKINREQNLSRNAAIVDAIREWLNDREPPREWSQEVKDWASQPELTDIEFDLARDEQDWGDFSL